MCGLVLFSMDVIVVVVLLISSNFQDNWIHGFLYKYKLDLGKLIIASLEY